MRKILTTIALALLPVPLLAVPPPPPPPGAIERATKIITWPTEHNVIEYTRLFTDDVAVFDNDKLVASGSQAWAAYLQPRLGLHYKILHVSYGNPIMVAETVNNMSYRGPDVVQDCCLWAQVVLYHLRDDGRADTVRFIENNSDWRPPKHSE